MGLINPTERIRCIKLMEYLNAKTQMPETDNLVYEVGTMQKLLYGTNFKRAKSSERNPELLLLIWNLNKITNFKASHKDFKPKDPQNIIFPKIKITYFLEIYEAEEPKLISIIISCYTVCYPLEETSCATYANSMRRTCTIYCFTVLS